MEPRESVAINAAQSARISLAIAQDCQSLVWVESTDKRDWVALRRAGDDRPYAYVDRDGELLPAGVPYRLAA
jgi:hypothetical protein